MNEPTNQQNLTSDEAAAALSFATKLSEDMMPKMEPEQAPEQPTEAPQEPQEAPQQEQPQEPVKDESATKIAELESKITEMEKHTQDTIRAEIAGIKDMIAEALKDDGSKD